MDPKKKEFEKLFKLLSKIDKELLIPEVIVESDETDVKELKQIRLKIISKMAKLNKEMADE